MAKKNKLHPIKLILTGVLWSAFYFGIFMVALGWFLDFNFLSATSWSEKYQAFIDYRWKIKTGFDFVLLFFMLFWIPLWLIGWRLVYLVKWEKFKPSPRRRTIVKKTFELNENKPLYHMPRKMPATVQVRRYVAPKLPNQVEEVKSGSKSHTNLVQMIRLIATLAKKYKVEIFQHILLEGNRVPMAISTDARAVLIEIVNRKNVNWSVEFSDDVTQSNWYSEGGVMDKLAMDLVRATASLAKSEPNSEILSAIIVTDGRILNTKQAVDYFKSKGIFLIGFNNAEPKSDLPDLASFLSAYFDLKDGETDPAPHPVEKVPLRQKETNQEQPSDNVSNDIEDDETDDETDEEIEEDEDDDIDTDDSDDLDDNEDTDMDEAEDDTDDISDETQQSPKIRAPMPTPSNTTTDE
ncbi:MAG: hypothetical protein IJY58_00700 [Alphaproteobacteria bacterium]|nr:hypothetical protein [Alphaproteobacteria bacterium]